MATDPPGTSTGRMGALLRHLGESAERDAATSAGLVSSLRRILGAPAEIGALLALVTAERPALDSAVVLVREGDAWQVAATLGASPAGTPAAWAPRLASTPAGLPLRVGSESVEGVLPTGTLSALVLTFGPPEGAPNCLVLLGSRSQPAITDHDAVVAHVAAERVARLVDAGRLATRSADAVDTQRRTGGFRDQVLAIVGHDLRNPLGAIVMSTSLLQRRGGDLGGWQARAVERIRASAGRMGRIIDDLLSYTRTRLGGGIPVVRRPTDLASVVLKIVEEVRVVNPQVPVEVECAGTLSGAWDEARLEQVISNLLSNAIDHGDEGAPVRVGLCGGLDRVEFAVVNEGEIPSAVLEHAFEAFHRGPEQDARKASGLGLGLYIAREIIRRHGGDISVRCVGGRTHVIVSLPRGGEDAEAAAPPGSQ